MIIRIIKYLICKIKFGRRCKFGFSSIISPHSSFEGMNQVHRRAVFFGRLGFGSYIAEDTKLVASIGRFTSVGPWVRSNSGIHPYQFPFVSTAPCFYSLNSRHSQNGSTFATVQAHPDNAHVKGTIYDVVIGNDCWIGEGVFFVGGITIGDGAVLLAHAVVTKDVPPYAIVGGIPAKILKYRYDNDTISFLLRCKWWNNTEDWFKNNWQLMTNIDKLKDYYRLNNDVYENH